MKYRLPSGEQVFKTTGSSRREAEDALSLIMGQIAKEGAAFRKPQNAHFDDFVTRFLKDNKHRYKESTLATYTGVCEKHLVPYWGHSKMRESVTVESITAYIGHSLDIEKSIGTINHSLNVLSAICSWAVKVDVLPHNPVHRIHRPKNHQVFNREIISADQIQSLLVSTPKGWKRNLVTIAAHTAMRAGELAALKTSDIDWSTDEILVSATVWRGRLQHTTKTGKSRRVPMSEAVKAAIREQVADSPSDSPSDYLFSNSSGGVINMARIGSGVLKPALHRAGIVLPESQRGWMALRHSAISLWCASGLPPATVAEISGHRVQTLYQHYLHSVGDDKKKVADLMNTFGQVGEHKVKTA